jgi:hypothetical protein
MVMYASCLSEHSIVIAVRIYLSTETSYIIRLCWQDIPLLPFKIKQLQAVVQYQPYRKNIRRISYDNFIKITDGKNCDCHLQLNGSKQMEELKITTSNDQQETGACIL